MRYLGVVPARAGSIGLPGKNWLELDGQSLVDRAIRSAQRSGRLEAVALSTDDSRGPATAEKLGAEFIPRSPFAATSEATASDVLRDVVAHWPRLTGNHDVNIVWLQPTSPRRTHEHVSEAITQMEAAGAESCLSVAPSPVSAFKLVILDHLGLVRTLHGDEAATANRAALPPTFLPNGAIYVFSLRRFLATGVIPLTGSYPYIMTPEDSIDIDTPADWERLQSLRRPFA